MLLCKTAGFSHCRWEFYFSPIKYAIPIPIRTIPISIPIPVSSPKLLLFSWESHGNESSFGLLMGMEMEIVLMEMGIAYFIGEK